MPSHVTHPAGNRATIAKQPPPPVSVAPASGARDWLDNLRACMLLQQQQSVTKWRDVAHTPPTVAVSGSTMLLLRGVSITRQDRNTVVKARMEVGQAGLSTWQLQVTPQTALFTAYLTWCSGTPIHHLPLPCLLQWNSCATAVLLVNPVMHVPVKSSACDDA
jgi:hypothetical protein